MIRPDYDGGSIVNLMSSLAIGLGARADRPPPARALPPALVREASSVVLLVVDGLGDDYLVAHPAAPHLNAARRDRLTSVFPSTTASAITTFLTGLAPAQHAVTGWHMYLRELGAVTTILPGRVRLGGPPLRDLGVDLPALLGNRAFVADLAVDATFVMPRDIADSAYTLAHTAGALVRSYETLGGLFDGIEDAVAGGAGFVHAYLPDLDAVGHGAGMGSERASGLLARIDAAFGACCDRLAGSNTLFVVCADHGQIDTVTEDWVTLEPDDGVAADLRIPLCGEPRAAYVYPGPGREAAVAEALEARLGGADCVVDAGRWREGGWFGPGPAHPELASRTGDLLVVPPASRAIKDWLPGERKYGVIGIHGGTTSAEMGVPLVAKLT